MNPMYRKKEKKNLININKYFIDNYDNIYNLEKNMKLMRGLVEDFSKNIQSSEKSRIVDNYTYMLGFARTFGFLDIVKKPIFEQMKVQFSMK